MSRRSSDPRLSTRGEIRALAAPCVVLAMAVWLSSGTMAPYGATFFHPVVSVPCGYLYNYDHPLHQAVFRMLDGQPRASWEQSPVLRRVLFPLVAYPFMKLAGYEVGGFVASMLMHIAALILLARFLRRRHGDGAAHAGAWLFAIYPGITYWAALPYANAAIVPASVGLWVLLARLDDQRRPAAVAAASGAMGLLFTAYDLAPFFGVAAVMVLLRRRRFSDVPIAIACMAVPMLVTNLMLKVVFHVPWTNANTAIYGTVLRAYLHPPGARAWMGGLADVPSVLVRNFFYSNMIFLPALFVLALAIGREPLSLTEGALAAAVLLVFLFNNLAPPYEGRWQMRGDFIPRLYQPLFIALLVYCARVTGAWRALPPVRGRLLLAVTVLAVLGNASIAFGPIARVPWAGNVYHRFYVHSGPDTMDRALAAAGRRPLGFCGNGPSAVAGAAAQRPLDRQ